MIVNKSVSVQAYLVLSIVYIVLIMPLGFFLQVFFKNTVLKDIYPHKKTTYWVSRKKQQYNLTWAKKQ